LLLKEIAESGRWTERALMVAVSRFEDLSAVMVCLLCCGLRQLHYPPGLFSSDEAGGLVTGPVDTTASCTGNANNSVCNAGEILQWTVGTLTPGRGVQLSLSPGVLGTAVDGGLIKWSAIATKDGQSLRRASVTLPIDTCNFLSDTDCDGVNDETGNCTDVADADQRTRIEMVAERFAMRISTTRTART